MVSALEPIRLPLAAVSPLGLLEEEMANIEGVYLG
jgi:hypothetical protein